MTPLERFVLAERGVLHRYLAAAALACGSLALVAAMARLEGTEFLPFTTLAVVLSGIYGGMGPALLAALIASVGVDYLFVEPLHDVLASWTAIVRLAIFLSLGALIAGIVGLLRNAYRDVHAQYLQTEAARHARETMLAIVSHDLRSPLTAVLLGIGYVKRALGEGRPPESLSGALDAIHRSADSMKRLVDDLLDAARIEAGRFSLQPSRQDLAPIVEDAVESGRLSADARRVRLDLDVPPGEHPVHCDRQRLTQVLANLIGNAVKFSPEGARVELRLREEAGWLRIDVRDWGPGIAEADLPHVFARYWQSTDTVHLGAGLGLYIARAIVESHGGRIEVRSRLGEGSTFSIYLRRAESD